MNKQAVYNEVAKTAQSNTNHYTFGLPSQIGLIEDLLSYFGISYKTDFDSESMHRDNLELLRRFIIEDAEEDQVAVILDSIENKVSAEELRPNTNHAGDVFVSMPMNKGKYAYVDMIRDGIKRGIETCGLTPYFLDLDAHNGNIFNKMLLEIRGCRFLVADFTSQNSGVYYEAGYAKALGKTVIHTCKESDFDNVHFDLKQTQFVTWETSEDLAKRLSMQIKKSNLGEVK